MSGVKKSLEHAPEERLRWRVLRTFGALPTEERVRAMKRRDFLWCALNLALDQEEELGRLCHACRAEAESGRCPVCGGAAEDASAGVNGSFDMARFARLAQGEAT